VTDGLPIPSGRKPKVLFICHNHPAVRPGGAEAYALELHRHLRDSEELESIFLAKGGPPLSQAGRPHVGTYVSLVGGSPDEYFLYTDGYDYDWTFGTIRDDKELLTKHLRSFLQAVEPDVVHLHHTMFFGYDVLREIRNTLPGAAIVYTLHEFMPICHRQGQMARTADDEPCIESSPRRCHECFPEISPQTFFMRKRFIQSHFELVDAFVAPSRFLLERYVDWGIPREKIVAEEYGRTPPPGRAVDDDREVRDRFGFFGQLTPFKGVQVVLDAVRLMSGHGGASDPLIRALEAMTAPTPNQPAAPEPLVLVHGANLDLQPGTFQNRISELLEETKDRVTFVGRYDHTRIADLMSNVDWVIVPSIWWENSPLVIQEAFHFGRPVICSDIGGMAEKVRDGIDGLHFRANDSASLARTMRMAMDTAGLWERLRAGIRPVHRMEEHVVTLRGIYESLRDGGEVAHVG
jgi:glycosyltransferase involved in cell wall biosynthesis